jgi:hypothetical protein
MKVSQMVTNRFGSPSVMTTDTRVRGSSAVEWEDAFTGGFLNTFAELEEKQQAYQRRLLILSPLPQPLDGHVTLDLASIASKKFAKVT